MGTSSQIKAPRSRPQKKSFKVKVDETSAATACKCKERRACLGGGGQLVKERYCTTLCHRSTALAAPLLVTCAEAEEEEKSGHSVRVAGRSGCTEPLAGGDTWRMEVAAEGA